MKPFLNQNLSDLHEIDQIYYYFFAAKCISYNNYKILSQANATKEATAS